MKTLELNLTELEVFCSDLASKFTGGEVILLEGDLGAGKTQFTKDLGKHLGIKEVIKSPTFVLLQKYEGEKLNLYHFDLYKLQNAIIHPDTFGMHDAMEDPKSVIVIEWADLIKDWFKEFIKIKFEILDNDTRKLEIEVKGEKYEELISKI